MLLRLLLRKANCRLVVLIFSYIILFAGLFLSNYVINKLIDFKKKPDETAINITKITLSRVRLLENELPTCSGNFLDQKDFYFPKDTKRPYDSNRLISPSGSCKLRPFTVDVVVACFDLLLNGDQHYAASTLNQSVSRRMVSHRELYYVFIGDSRIRQQFYNFVKLIPNYDKKSRPIIIPSAYHGDINVTSEILRLRVSFLWRPFINETLMEEMSRWANGETERPCFILLGMAVHHMVPIPVDDQYKYFQKRLLELGPFLGRLAHTSNVIWLNQYPTLELYGERVRNYNIYADKIHRYNKRVRRILENYNEIQIWDSSNSLAEEYVRGCTIFQRDLKTAPNKTITDYATAYINCDDYVHPGYSALSKATQLLYNQICNNPP